MIFRAISLGLCLVFLCFNSLSAQEKEDWNQWRGPNRDGMIAGATWPDSISGNDLVEKWRVDLGPSYSGPLAVGDRVYVTESKDKKYEVVRALDANTGEEIWNTNWTGSMNVPFFAKKNGSWIRSTPTYSEGLLFVAGMRDTLVCLNAENGKKLWNFDFVSQMKTPVPQFGFVCSPLVMGDHVYVQAGASFCKLEKRTGKLVWSKLKDQGGMYGSAFSSPVVATLAGKEQILVQTRTMLAGIDPADGSTLWSEEIPSFRGMNILTPTVLGNAVFTSSYQRNSHLFEISTSSSGQSAVEKWKGRSQAYMSSPIVIDGHAYVQLNQRRVACIDLATGEEKWKIRSGGEYWSMVSDGKKILALDQTGELILFNATPEKFDVLDKNKISTDETWAHLAIRDKNIFVRELNAIVAYEWVSP